MTPIQPKHKPIAAAELKRRLLARKKTPLKGAAAELRRHPKTARMVLPMKERLPERYDAEEILWNRLL